MDEAEVVNLRDALTPPQEPVDTEGVEEYARQFNVELAMIPWKGAWATTEEESTILVTRNVRVNGHLMEFVPSPEPEHPKLGEVYTIEHGEARIEIGPFAMIYLHRLKPECREALDVTENDWMEQTTEDTLVLPVSNLAVRMLGKDEMHEEPTSY